MRNNKFSQIAAIAAAFIVLGNVSCGERLPFTNKVNAINEAAPQQQALILLSDPQFYARATLVDDRRREAAFLEQLLDESKTVQFEPQLRRELASISALSSQLGLTFDPARALSYASSKQLGELDKEIRVTELQIQLGQLQQQLKALRAGEVSVPSPPPPGGLSNITPATSVSPPGAEVLKASSEELRSLIEKANDGLKAITGEIKGATTKSSPQEVFRDRQAYRDELRAALSLVNLDDRHDDNGNALFQLQFRATIFPGKNKDQYGATRVSIALPQISVEHLNHLYHDILNLVSYEVNATGNHNVKEGQAINYEEIGRESGLFELVDLYAATNAAGISDCEVKGRRSPSQSSSLASRKLAMAVQGCETVYLAVPRNLSAYIRAITSNAWDKKLRGLTRDLLPQTEAVAPRGNFDREASQKSAQSICETIGKSLDELVWQSAAAARSNPLNEASTDAYTLVTQLLFIKSALSEAMKGVLLRSKTDHPIDVNDRTQAKINRKHQVDINQKLQQLNHVIHERLNVELQALNLIRKSGYHKCDLVTLSNIARTTIQFPDELGIPLVRNYADAKRKYTEAVSKTTDLGFANGSVYVYSAGPVEHAQRTSTLTSAVDAMQMTMALSAVLPNNGVGVSTGLGVMQHALGKAEALERNPVVVGFSGNYKKVDSMNDPRMTIPSFGWIFGPRIVVDPSKSELRLEQAIGTHQVWAEISAPAWWPLLPLETETSWIHNWYDNGAVLDLFQQGASVSKIRSHVPLPHKRRADLQSLLFDLARNASNESWKEVSIQSVNPDRISRCNQASVTFLIEGAGVWRTTKAYLAGLPHSEIQVLPDMQGVAVKFNLAELPRLPERPILSVYTRRGSDDKQIDLIAELDGKVCGDEQPKNSVKKHP